MANSEIQYRMKCPVCGGAFAVDTLSSRVPKHPVKGQTEKPGVEYVPCKGSGLRGIVAGTKARPPN